MGAGARPSSSPARYATILADPPWDIQQKGSYGAERHYPLMSVEEIRSLRVDRLAADSGHLWLWTTNAALHEAFHVMKVWGYSYRGMPDVDQTSARSRAVPAQPDRASVAGGTRQGTDSVQIAGYLVLRPSAGTQP